MTDDPVGPELEECLWCGVTGIRERIRPPSRHRCAYFEDEDGERPDEAGAEDPPPPDTFIRVRRGHRPMTDDLEWNPDSRLSIDAHSVELIDSGEGDGATLQVRGDSWEVDIDVDNGDVLQLVTDGAEYVASVSARMMHDTDA